MSKHIVFRILAGLVLLAAVAGIAFFAFNAGLMHGVALNIEAPAASAGDQPIPFYRHGMAFHHHSPFFGFGCFGILIPLFLLFLFFGAMRHLLWGPRWGHHMHMHGPWGEGVPPMFAEWHRRAHGEQPAGSGETPEK